MQVNYLIILAAAIVPMLMGFIWYHPNVLGTAWMKAADMSQEKMKGSNMLVIFGFALLFSFFLAMELQFVVIHQWSIYSIMANDAGMKDPNSDISKYVSDFMMKYGTNFRTFKHGAFHGTVAGFMLALPIIGTNALFERKGFKYVAINAGFWIINLALMGGIICAFS